VYILLSDSRNGNDLLFDRVKKMSDMKKFYIVLIGLLIGSSVGFEALGQIDLPYAKADDGGWIQRAYDKKNASKLLWSLSGDGLSIGVGNGDGQSGERVSEDWAISPALQLKDVSNFLEYSDVRGARSGSAFAVMIAQGDGVTVPDVSDFVTVEQWTSLQTIETPQRVDLTPWSGQIVHVAFLRTNELGGSWTINNIEVIGSDLAEVENFKVSEITNGSISLSWTEPENNLEYLIVGAAGEIDFVPQTGISYAVTDPAGSNTGIVLMSGTGISFTESGLDEFQTRYYKIWSYDPITHEYALAGQTANGTTIGASTVFYEDFEGTNLITDITQGTPDQATWTSTKYNWTIESLNIDNGDFWLPNGTETSYRGSQSAHIVQKGATPAIPVYAENTGDSFEESILVNISAADLDKNKYKSAELSFFWKAGGKAGYDYGDVYINGTRMTAGGLSGQTKWKEEVIDITSELSHDITLEFYWKNDPSYTGVHEPSFCVDEVMITGKSVERPASFSATVINVSQIDLSWEKNSESQDVLIAYSPSGTLGSPDENAVYAEGDILPGGGEVIYKGAATTFSHDIEGESRANYKIWSVSTANTYSTALSASTVLPGSLPFFDGFEEGFDWNTEPFRNNDWYAGQAKAKDGNYSAYVSNNGGFTTDWSVNSGSNAPTILELPVNLAGFTDISVSFDYLIGGRMNSAPDNYDINNAKVFLENGGVSEELTFSGFVDQSTWNSASGDFSTSTLFGASSLLRFNLYDDSNFSTLSFVVDNVSITGTLSPVADVLVENNGGLKNNISWTNAAENLEVVIVSGINNEPLGELTSGDTYFVGDILDGGGKVVYVGTGVSHNDENVMPGQTYEYKVFQKNGLTYSMGVVGNTTVTVPDNVSFFEDFEGDLTGWNKGSAGANVWFVGKPVNDNGNTSNVAFISDNGGANAQFSQVIVGKNDPLPTLTLSKNIIGPAFSNGTFLQFDYLFYKGSSTESSITVNVIDNNSASEWNYSSLASTNSSWTTTMTPEAISPTAVDGNIDVTLEFVATIEGVNNNPATISPGFLIDNVSITGSYDNTSTVSNGAGGVASLSSLKETEAEAVEVFTFDIKDASSGDAKPTDIHQMTITPGTENLLTNWREVIGGAALYDASDALIAYGSIQTQGIFFDQENMISVADDGTENFKLKIWLRESLDTSVDNGVLDFQLFGSDIVAYNGSSFDASSTNKAESNTSTVTIDATELRWSQHPSVNAVEGTVLSTQPVVLATDANGNIDNDYISDVSLTSTPAGVSGTFPGTSVAGVTTFTDIVFGTVGTYVLEATSGVLASVTSQDITVSEDNGVSLGGLQHIGAVKLAGIENYTYERSAGGYGLFLDQEARMTKGMSYEMYVYVSGGANLKVYVDFDKDGSFEVSEMIKDFSWKQDQVAQGFVSIPTDVATGTYHLRVEFLNGTDGEIEDYTVIATDNQWTGYTPEWDVTANWSSEQVPTDKVYIPGNPVDGNFFPVIKEDKTINELILESGSNITVKPGVAFTIANDVTNNGQFVLESTADNLSSLMLPSNATKVGDANVKLEVPKNHYWYLSTPLANARAEWFGNLNSDPNAEDWVFVLRESGGKNKWLRVVGDIPLNPLEGVSTWYYNQDKQLDYSGTLNQGDITFTYGQPDYYLLGNPYATSIDWDVLEAENRDGLDFAQTMWFRVSRTGFDGETYRTWQTYNTFFSAIDPEELGYSIENESYIAPYQTVWIKADVSNATFTVSENSKVKHTGALPLKSAGSSNNSEMDVLRIKAVNDKTVDGAVIFFNNAGDSGRDSFDSDKRFNDSKAIPELYTMLNSTPLAINSLPQLSGTAYSIPLSVRNRIEGEVKLSVDVREFTDAYDVVLEDKELSSWINMRDVSEYAYNPRIMGDDHDRFVLHLSKVQKVPTDIEESVDDASNIQIIGKKDYAAVRISPELLQSSEAVIHVLDVNGRQITNKNTRDTETEIALPSENGVYVVRVNAGGTVKTQKVVR